MKEKNTSDKRFWLGIIFVTIGGLWLLDNLNIIPDIPDFLISWRSFLIVLGVFLILGRGKLEPGIILIAIGSIFILEDLNILEWRNIWQFLWPAIIIIIGISLIFRRNYRRGSTDEKKYDLNYIDEYSIFGGREVMVNAQEFKGGKITAMFGGSSIDLRNADLAMGTHKLDLFAMFGGASLLVPPDWTIQVEVFSLLGGFSDNRSSSLKVVPNPDKVLIITGFVMFGGGDIKFNK